MKKLILGVVMFCAVSAQARVVPSFICRSEKGSETVRVGVHSLMSQLELVLQGKKQVIIKAVSEAEYFNKSNKNDRALVMMNGNRVAAAQVILGGEPEELTQLGVFNGVDTALLITGEEMHKRLGVQESEFSCTAQ